MDYSRHRRPDTVQAVKRFAVLFLFLFPVCSWGLSLPRNLSSSDRQQVLSALGFGSKAKILSSPVPLGGDEGVEIGLSNETILLSDLVGLGIGGTSDRETSYQVLTFGKGLVYNIDTFFHVTPLLRKDGIFGYGAHARWGFWEFESFPAVMSAVLHGSGMNYGNVLSTRTTGFDILTTIAIEDVALYFGGGKIRTIGTFSGGDNGLTREGNTKDEDLSDLHTVFGLSLSFQKLFLTLELDRVIQTSYAVRISYRY